MNFEKVVKTRKSINKWLSPLLIISLFLFIAILLIFKFTNRTFYYFNNRFDVVLSNSMSYKNPQYAEFLKGHDNQIMKDDFVISSRIGESTPLDIYDIVLFNSKDFGTNMHRIVDIKYEGTRCSLDYWAKGLVDDVDVMYFSSIKSELRFKDSIVFTDFEAICYSTDPFDSTEFSFLVNNSAVNVNVISSRSGDYYKNVLSYHNDSTQPCKFAITKQGYAFDSKFEYIKLYSDSKEYLVTPGILSGEEQQVHLFYPIPLYETRGDASNTSDGWFYREQLISKVHTVIPKFGVFIHFITSPWGIAMVIGLASLPVIYSFFVTYKRKEKK